MIRLFAYYGSKIKMSGRYPRPLYDTIVEPFAGAAGYSCRYADRRVILYEKDPKIGAVLEYLIGASSAEIMSLPLLDLEDTVDDFVIPQEARWMIGMWVNSGVASPRKSLSRWAKEKIDNLPANFWGPKCRSRLAQTVSKIKHWKLYRESYENAVRHTEAATWFIDPPYQKAGKCYAQHEIDYSALGDFCKSRRGQVIVCENDGADWLPFDPLYEMAGAAKSGDGRKKSKEMIWRRRSCKPAD